MSEAAVEGGCRCGAVRYRLRGPALFTLQCHCADCRRSAGGPVQTWISYLKDQVSYAAGRPKRHQSSTGVWRGFCAACGTPLVYEAARIPDEVHVLAGTLDSPRNPGARAPRLVGGKGAVARLRRRPAPLRALLARRRQADRLRVRPLI